MIIDMYAPRPETAEAILECENLEKSYAGGAPVLRGVALRVGPGERVALIGANGSGKSTLLRCVIGMTSSDKGAVSILGQRFVGSPSGAQRRRLRREIGVVFQHHSLVRRRSALSNVLHGLLGEPGGWRAVGHPLAPAAWRERAMAALDEVGLADFATRRADALSGGQQQRVAIARALVRAPRLIIADEPAASLDPAAGRDVMALFAERVAARGASLLFTSHDMEHARSFADRLVALKGGRVVLDRPTAALSTAEISEVFDA